MGETSKYHLYVTDDRSTLFSEWRDKMNGETNSNMVKIDNALDQKADHSTHISGAIPASGWEGEEAPFTQTIQITGLTADGNGSISVSQGATAAQREAARLAMLNVTSQGVGELTIVADGEKPEIDIPFTVILLK